MLKKDITFIYYDGAEKAQFDQIAKEAIKRGYSIKFTQNKFEKCEIGFYCQHDNFPQYSKFSVIMLHDIIQQYSNWPDIWFREPWNKYDIGILPSKQWVDNWNKCSQYYYTNPRIGVFEIGWPKADVIRNYSKEERIEFYKKFNMDINKKTILYAPAWENDNKQDDFVQAMLKLDVNILIKQAPWSSPNWLEARPDIYENVVNMKKLHENIPTVTILDDQLNIFDAIAASDILVSEESSTMCEATMMGIPAVSVSNWLIPDQIPSRHPKCDYDFVTKTTKEELSNCICTIINNYEKYKKETEEFSKNNFSNVGNTSKMIVDIIDDIIGNNKIRYNSLAKTNKAIAIKQYIKHIIFCYKRELVYNQAKQNKTIKKMYNVYRKIKEKL